MKKSILSKAASLLTVLCLMSALAGCGSTDANVPAGDSSKSEATTAAVTAANTDAPVELSLWNVVDDPNNAMSLRFDAAYKKTEADLGVTIKYEAIAGETYKTKIKVALAGNELPDIFHMYPGGDWDPFLAAKAAAPLNDVLAGSGLGKEFYEGYIPEEADGNTYGLPFRVDPTYVMYYNKTVLGTLGVEPPKNYDDLKKVAAAANAKGIGGIGLGDKERWMGDLFYNMMVLREDPRAYEKAIKGELKFTDAPFVTAAEKVNELIRLNAFQSGYMTAVESDVVELFSNDKIALYPIGTWSFSNLIDKLGDKLGYIPFPAVGADANAIESSTGAKSPRPFSFMANAGSKNLEKAKLALVTFIKNNNDLGVKDGELAYMQTGVQPDKPLNAELAKYAEDSKKIKFVQTFWFDSGLPKEQGEPYRDLNQKLFTGKMDPKAYCEEQQKILGTK